MADARHGAHVGDVFMGLIYTCELCGANPFDDLTELDRHVGRVGVNPQNWRFRTANKFAG